MGPPTATQERLANRLSAACYGTVLVLAALPLIDADDVATGWGWELITGVGIATWVAHLFAEVVGDHVRWGSPPNRHEIRRAAADGSPILLASVLPAVMLLFGRLELLDERVAMWTAVAVAVAQLAAVGAFAGSALPGRSLRVLSYAGVTAGLGLAVVSLKLALGH